MRALSQYYDNFGKSKFEFVDKTTNDAEKNWKYSQMIKLSYPNFVNTLEINLNSFIYVLN